jgi:hypothetical protein
MQLRTCSTWWGVLVLTAVACEGSVAVPQSEVGDSDSEDDEDDQDDDDVVEPSTTGDDDVPDDDTVDPAPEVCGDGILDGDEECDGFDLGVATCADYGAFAGELSCRSDCTIETCACDWGEGPTCEPPVCGNSVAEGGEECDGLDIPGWDFVPTCEDILGEPYRGDVFCNAECRIDTSSCGQCGDGVVEIGFEDCDGTPLDEFGEPLVCREGYAGEYLCNEECEVEEMCEPLCGNAVVDAGEDCDGEDLGAATCESLGFVGGELSCYSGCELRTDDCTMCGNGVVDLGEECDAADFGGATCGNFVLGGEGELACSSSCEIDAVGCVPGGGTAVISEIMVASLADPLDNVGEWIELHNRHIEPFDLAGCELRGQAGFETFAFEGSLVIEPGGYVTLGQGTEVELGFVPDYVLPEQVTLLNDGDLVRLVCAGIDVDEITYDALAPWPDHVDGTAIAVVSPVSAADNDDGSDWCAATTVYALEQRGTPGAANDCP